MCQITQTIYRFFAFLSAGGNLYREISDDQCVKLLKQSIDFLHFYPFVVDYRPTVIALPTSDSGTPDALLPRLELLKGEYEALIKADANNKVLGESSDYYKLYSREEVNALKQHSIVDKPQTCDEWMIPVAKNIDLDKVQKYSIHSLWYKSMGLTFFVWLQVPH
jgi:hypothetical protein